MIQLLDHLFDFTQQLYHINITNAQTLFLVTHGYTCYIGTALH